MQENPLPLLRDIEKSGAAFCQQEKMAGTVSMIYDYGIGAHSPLSRSRKDHPEVSWRESLQKS
jgi:hypothetical protein